MDNITILNVIIFMVIVIYILNIFVQKYKYKELFQSEGNIPLGLNTLSDRNIDYINNDSNLFGLFCKKLNILDDNSPLSKQFKAEIEIDKLKLKQKKATVEKLVETIFDYQKKIYNNPEEIKNINEYRNKLNDQAKIKIGLINKAYDNVKKTLLNKTKVNIHLEQT